MPDRKRGDARSTVPDECPVLLAHLMTEVRTARQRAVIANSPR